MGQSPIFDTFLDRDRPVSNVKTCIRRYGIMASALTNVRSLIALNTKWFTESEGDGGEEYATEVQ